MIRRLLTGGLGRAIVILGVILFAIYGIVAVVLSKLGQDTAQGVVAAVMGYLFIVGVVLLWWYERRLRTRPGPVAEQFLGTNREVLEMIGSPVKVVIPTLPEVGKGPGQITVDCFVTGPEGSGEAAVVMARLDRGFQVLGADLDIAGVRRSVSAGTRIGG